MRAASICVLKELPFSLNMVLTAQNRGEVEEMVSLAERLGSVGIRFGHLMPTRDTALRNLDLTPAERREIEDQIWRPKKTASIPVGMAPGYFSEAPFFPCGPLELQEYNVDYKGNLTLCCQLSGHSTEANAFDVIGNLNEMSLAQACARFRQRVATYLEDKRNRISRGEFTELDHFPCWYCLKYVGRTAWLETFPNHPWARQETMKEVEA
jgi:MoaA/NifB/PqqE/SkfB family radical SAM enzyme